jgi:ComF family protein
MRGAADLIMPPVCLYCRKPLAEHDCLCGTCWREVRFIRPPLCDRLGIPLPFDVGSPSISAAAAANPPDYDRARAVAHFDGVVRDLIHQLKYADSHIARRLFGRWLLEAGAELLADAELIVPVPLDRWRLIKRRFNQAAVLSRELNRLTGVAWDPLALMRTRRTVSQVGLTHDQRRRNVQGAFAVAAGRGSAIEGRSILLIDDVITTGATVGACARALRQAGAARVDVLALALVTADSMVDPA